MLELFKTALKQKRELEEKLRQSLKEEITKPIQCDKVLDAIGWDEDDKAEYKVGSRIDLKDKHGHGIQTFPSVITATGMQVYDLDYEEEKYSVDFEYVNLQTLLDVTQLVIEMNTLQEKGKISVVW